MSAKEEIIKTLVSMSGRYSAYSIFRDWVECMAIALQNSCVINHTDEYHADLSGYK